MTQNTSHKIVFPVSLTIYKKLKTHCFNKEIPITAYMIKVLREAMIRDNLISNEVQLGREPLTFFYPYSEWEGDYEYIAAKGNRLLKPRKVICCEPSQVSYFIDRLNRRNVGYEEAPGLKGIKGYEPATDAPAPQKWGGKLIDSDDYDLS